MINIDFCFSDPIPIIVFGEGNYALTDIKQIKVTEDFLSLGEQKTKCQDVEEYNHCLTRIYGQKILDICDCSPLSLKSFFPEKVSIFVFIYFYFYFVSPQVKVCTPEGLDCVAEIRAEEESCLNNCEGLITGVMNKPVRHLNNNFLDNLILDYDSYKSTDYSKIYFFNSIKGCTLKNSPN